MLRPRSTRLLCAIFAAASIGLIGCEPEGGLAEPGTYPSSSRLGISPDGAVLYVALPDHELVRAVDAESGEILGEVPVAGHPHRLSVLSDGRVAVSARHAGEVAFLDARAGEVLSRVEVGADPHGLLEADGHLVVALAGAKELARVDLSDATRVKDRVALDYDEPRALARGGDGTLFVSHFHAGVVSAVDLERGVPEQGVDMYLEENPFFVPNQMDSLTVSPDGTEIAAPHEECNNDPAQFTSGGSLAGSFPQYYVEGPTGFPAVVPAVSRLDAVSRVNVSQGPGAIEPFSGMPEEPAGPAPAIINPLDTLLLGDDFVNAPVAVALADGGRVEILVNRGSGNVLLRRTRLQEGQRSVLAVLDAKPGVSSVVLSPDGGTAWVYNDLEHELLSFDVPHVEDGSRSGPSVFARQSDDTWNLFEDNRLPRVEPRAQLRVAEDVLPDDVVLGRKLFISVDARMTRRGAIACQSCHPDGGADAITWSFEEGPRQTPPLWGGVSETAPFHWDQAADTFADISRITIQARMGGSGLQPREMNAIAAFLDTVPAPAAPIATDLAAVDRGAALFHSEETGCVSCHAGAHFTDGLSHDVGTGPSFTERESREAFATPVLHGLARTAPYLHDGSAETVRDVIERLVRTDRMGTGSHLSDGDVDDLVAFLTQL